MNLPMHDKLRAVHRDSQIIGNFLDWMKDNGFESYRHPTQAELSQRIKEGWSIAATNEMIRDPRRIQEVLADYLEIDLKVLEEEKVAMLEEQRALNEKSA